MSTKTVDVDGAVDVEFEKFLEEIQARNPELFQGRFSLNQAKARQLLLTTFTLGFVAGETNAVKKLQ